MNIIFCTDEGYAKFCGTFQIRQVLKEGENIALMDIHNDYLPRNGEIYKTYTIEDDEFVLSSKITHVKRKLKKAI